MSAPRFYLVTNDAPLAALEIWCHPGNVPHWIAIVDHPDGMMKLPNGAVVRCYWYGTRATIAAWESWWTGRREKGGIQFIEQSDWEKIEAWAEEHRKWPSLKLLTGEEPEVANDNDCESGAADVSAAAPGHVQEEAAASPADTLNQPVESVKRKAKWS